jgi:peptidoglycan hydrolase CwlO-like protein
MIEDLGHQLKSLRQEVESLRDCVESPAKKRARIEADKEEEEEDDDEEEEEEG